MCSGSDNTTCEVFGEHCEDGFCKCGYEESCHGRMNGAYCESANSDCRCTRTLPSCSDLSKGDYCDTNNNVCRCSETEPECTGNRTCQMGQCIGRYRLQIRVHTICCVSFHFVMYTIISFFCFTSISWLGMGIICRKDNKFR